MTEWNRAVSEPKPGWYIAWHKEHPENWFCIERRSYSWLVYGTPIYIRNPPDDLTLGPALDDLMRDAARYRWLRERRSYPFGSTDWDDVDELIDAEIAREKSE